MTMSSIGEVRRLKWSAWAFLLPALLALGLAQAQSAWAQPSARRARIPIILDTDVGTDIDDAFAIALITKCPELELLGVTTVSGDTRARARIAAKMLWVAGGAWREVPVFAGDPGPAQPIDQARWAAGFSSPSLHLSGAVPFLRETIQKHPGQVTIVAIGELTNLAALLKSDPSIGAKIAQIALMGGAVRRGYDPGQPPVPEWNIKSNIPAAQQVFDSGIPLIVAPLDATSMLKLDAAGRKRCFNAAGPIGEAVKKVYECWVSAKHWGGDTPTLYDPMAVAMLVQPGICRSERLALTVDDQGLTRIATAQAPNAVVGLEARPADFFTWYLGRVAP